MTRKRPNKGKADIARFDDGAPIAVGRPKDGPLAVKIVEETMTDPKNKRPDVADDVWRELEKRLDKECGPYTFVGYMATNKEHENQSALADEFGNLVGYMEPGDSLMHPSAFENDESN